jgi:AraC-like DNA-binding protein
VKPLFRQLQVTSKLWKRVPRPFRATGGANGRQLAVSQDGNSQIPIWLGLNAKTKHFPIYLLPEILASPGSSVNAVETIFQSITHPGVARCLRFIGRNPCLKLRDLVNISGLSLRGLNKAFRTHLGCTPGAVVVMMRLWSACDLLASSRLPVARVATCCGYRNSNGLCVAFQRYLGITPGRIRGQSPVYGLMDAKRDGLLSCAAFLPAIAKDVNNSMNGSQSPQALAGLRIRAEFQLIPEENTVQLP